jgi:ABC-type multidrug transport system ATPase subunit
MNVIISVRDLVKKYGEYEAVKCISFDVMEGEIFGLLGPNGAGKSTTLEIIETLRLKTSGEITVCGFSLDREPGKIKSIIGVQLQTSGFYPGLKLVELMSPLPEYLPASSNSMSRWPRAFSVVMLIPALPENFPSSPSLRR